MYTYTHLTTHTHTLTYMYMALCDILGDTLDCHIVQWNWTFGGLIHVITSMYTYYIHTHIHPCIRTYVRTYRQTDRHIYIHLISLDIKGRDGWSVWQLYSCCHVHSHPGLGKRSPCPCDATSMGCEFDAVPIEYFKTAMAKEHVRGTHKSIEVTKLLMGTLW